MKNTRRQYKQTELMLTIANKMLAAHKLLSYSIDLAANSATECGSSEHKGAQRRVSGFFVPALWWAVRGRSFGLPVPFVPVFHTCAQFATHHVEVIAANSKNTKEFQR